MDTIIAKVNELKDFLNYHNHKYYVMSEPEISDFEFDMKLRELEGIENSYPSLITEDSPTQRVGGEAISKFEKVKHVVPVLSVKDVFSKEELFDDLNKIRSLCGDEEVTFSVEDKIDGLSMVVLYEGDDLEDENKIDDLSSTILHDGNNEANYSKGASFVRAVSRGDGQVEGELLSSQVKTIKTVPLKLKYNIPLIEVRQEVYMPKHVLQELNENQERLGLELIKNSRNGASGACRNLDSRVTAKRKLDTFVFNVQRIEGMSFKTHAESLEYLKRQGFKVIPYTICSTNEEVWECIVKNGEARAELPYDIDGQVIKVNSLDQRQKLSYGEKYDNWCVAYKFPEEEKSTVIKDIIIQVGRSGILTPVAILEKLDITGSTVGRCTLNNSEFINTNDIRVGDVIKIIKSGGVIPKFVCVDVSKRTGDEYKFEMPLLCPECLSPVESDTCSGDYCPAKILRRLEHFCEKGAIEIEGLGPALIELLYTNGFLNSLSDIYTLREHKFEISQLEGLGEKSVSKLLCAIENSTNKNLYNLIYALGIPNVGTKGARDLANRFECMDALSDATYEQIIAIPDIGDITAKSVVAFFRNDKTKELISKLRSFGLNFNVIKDTVLDDRIDNRFEGMTFVITGTFSSFSRDEFIKIVNRYNGSISEKVSKKISYVVAGKNPKSKLTKANELGVTVLSENEFVDLIDTSEIKPISTKKDKHADSQREAAEFCDPFDMLRLL